MPTTRRRSATASASSELPSAIADPGPYEPEEQQAAPVAPKPRATRKGKAAPVDMGAMTDLCKLCVGSLSYVLGLVAAAPDMALAEDLSMTQQEATQIAVPLAHMLSGTALIRKYASAINNGNDAVQLVGGLFDYGTRFASVYFERRPIRAQRRQSVSGAPSDGRVASTGPVTSGEAGYNGAAIPSHLLAA